MTVFEILGNRLAEWRQRSGDPLKKIALALGVSEVSVSNWERGLKFPSGAHLDALSAYMGIPVHCLLCEEAETCQRQGKCRDEA